MMDIAWEVLLWMMNMHISVIMLFYSYEWLKIRGEEERFKGTLEKRDTMEEALGSLMGPLRASLSSRFIKDSSMYCYLYASNMIALKIVGDEFGQSAQELAIGAVLLYTGRIFVREMKKKYFQFKMIRIGWA